MCAKRVLVTGGAGFLGSHLCASLISSGHEVICLDNFYTGKRENVAHLNNLHVIEHDVCDPIDLEVDEIYNLACPASPKHYQKDPIFTMRTCVIGSLNMLELARKNKARILQASTSEVYGDPTVHPQPEEYRGSVSTTGSRACYDEGKRAAETLFFDFKRFHNVDIAVARIFNTYGPNMDEDDGRVVSNFIVQSLKNESLTLHGKGEQTRSFCYVDDLIRGLILLMESGKTGPMNLGNPEEYTVHELAYLICKKTGSDAPHVFQPMPEDDPKMRRPNIEKAKAIGFAPTISLDEGLEKTIEFFSCLQGKENL